MTRGMSGILPVYFLGFGTLMVVAPYLRCQSARYLEHTAPRGNIVVKYFFNGSTSARTLVKQANSCAIVFDYRTAFRN